MRRTFTVIIVGFLLLSAIVIYVFTDQVDQTLQMLSIKKDYARVLTEDEVVDIPIYISSNESFLTTQSNIIDAQIISDADEVNIDIALIIDQNQKITFEDKAYYLFHYRLDFSSIYTKNLKLNMPNAYLKLVYNNDDEFQFGLGHMQLLFHDLDQATHLDFNRLYATYYQGAISGIVLDLENKTSQTIEIQSIDNLNQQMNINLSKNKVVYDLNEHIDDLHMYLPNHQIIGQVDGHQESLMVYQDTQFILPINHHQTLSYLNRFPLIINYKYNQVMYTYIIDDYKYFEPISDLYNDYYEVEYHQYQYS
ncbi:MAG TPA: hypothetical protein VJ878_03800 [Candidatus Izemoplasmatales bacterium]|nr:hypothetical protein [Candidatus Izemoplasmatales bacterium]